MSAAGLEVVAAIANHRDVWRSEVDNHMPVNLTNVPCKMLELIIRKRLTLCSQLCNGQHEFAKDIDCHHIPFFS